MLPDEALDRLASDKRIVRNPQKIRATFQNARFVCDIADAHGSFGRFVADWPGEDIVGLWDVFKKRGARLGGMTGPFTLRMMGKDTFIFGGDVVKALIAAGAVEKEPDQPEGHPPRTGRLQPVGGGERPPALPAVPHPRTERRLR